MVLLDDERLKQGFKSEIKVLLLGSSNIFQYQTSEHEAEDGGDVGKRTVYLRFRGAPFVVQQRRVARTVLRLGTHTLFRAAGGVMPSVL